MKEPVSCFSPKIRLEIHIIGVGQLRFIHLSLCLIRYIVSLEDTKWVESTMDFFISYAHPGFFIIRMLFMLHIPSAGSCMQH